MPGGGFRGHRGGRCGTGGEGGALGSGGTMLENLGGGEGDNEGDSGK